MRFATGLPLRTRPLALCVEQIEELLVLALVHGDVVRVVGEVSSGGFLMKRSQRSHPTPVDLFVQRREGVEGVSVASSDLPSKRR